MSKEKRNQNLRILFSVAVAIALWVFVAFGESTDIAVWERNVKVDVVGQSSLKANGLVMVMASAPTADVRLSGSRQNFYRKEEGDVTAKIDVSSIDEPGTYTLSVSGDSSIHGATVTETSPAKINITVEPLVTVTKAVDVETLGKCAAHFSVSDISCDPVSLTGPESIVKSLSVVAEPISVEGAEKDVVARTSLRLTNGNGKVITREDTALSVRTVEVTCNIQYETTVPVRVDITGSAEEGYTVETEADPGEIMIFGDKKLLDGIGEVSTVPVDITGITDETVRTVRLDLPDGVTAAKENRITVHLKPVRSAGTELPAEEPSPAAEETDAKETT